MGRFIARPGRNFWPNAARWAAARPATRRSRVVTGSRRSSSSTQSVRCRHGGKGNEPELLTSCYRCCFGLARAKEIRTFAFPAISCGAYGYPLQEAALIAVREAGDTLGKDPELKVWFTCFTDDVFRAYTEAIDRTGLK